MDASNSLSLPSSSAVCAGHAYDSFAVPASSELGALGTQVKRDDAASVIPRRALLIKNVLAQEYDVDGQELSQSIVQQPPGLLPQMDSG